MRITSVDFLSLTEVVRSLGKGLKIKLPPHDELILGIPCLVWLAHLKKIYNETENSTIDGNQAVRDSKFFPM